MESQREYLWKHLLTRSAAIYGTPPAEKEEETIEKSESKSVEVIYA